jgi:hypothetical protein
LRIITRIGRFRKTKAPTRVIVGWKRHGGRILVDGHYFGSRVTSDRERGTLNGVTCESSLELNRVECKRVFEFENVF